MVQFASAQCTVSVRQEGTLGDNNTAVTLVLEGGQPIEWVNTTTGTSFTGYSIQTSEPGDYVVTAQNYDTYNYPDTCSTTYTLEGSSGVGCDFVGHINYAWQASHIVMQEGGYLLFEDLNGNQIYRDGSLLLDSAGNIATENYIGIITEVFGGSATMVYGSAGAFTVTLSGSAPIASLKFTDAEKNILATFPYSTECDVCSVEIQQNGEFSEHNNTVALVALGSGNLLHEWTNIETGATYTGWSITISEPGLYRLRTTDLATGDVCGDFVEVAPYYANPGMHFDGTQSVTIPFSQPVSLPDLGYSTFELVINPDMGADAITRVATVTIEYESGLIKPMYVNLNMSEDNAVFEISPISGITVPRGDCSMISFPSSFDDIDWTSAPMYLNGTEAGTYRGWIENYSPIVKITVGYNPDLTYGTSDIYEGYKGYIKEMRIWSVSRSKAQVNATANTELTGNEIGLEGYWKFDERDGQEVIDYSHNGNNGYRGLLPTEDAADPDITESCNIADIPVEPLNINYTPGQISADAYPNPMGEYLYVTNTGDVLRDIRFNIVNVNTGTTEISIQESTFAPGEEYRIITRYLDSGSYVLQIIQNGSEIETINLIK